MECPCVHPILRAESSPPPVLIFCPSTFPAAPLACGRTLLDLLAVLSAVLRSIFAVSQNPPRPHRGRKRAVFVFAAFLLLTGGNARAQGSVACPGGGYDPVPVEVPVGAVPIVVASTTDDYFVLYVRHDVDDTVVMIPVAVTLGATGTTTLAENVEALPKERYRVEKVPRCRSRRRRRRLHRRHHRARRPGGHEPGEPRRRHRSYQRHRGRSPSGNIRDALHPI